MTKLTPSERMTLSAVVSGTLRRRPNAPPLSESPLVMSMVERGLVRIDGNRLRITEDGLAALECAEHDAG